MQFCIGVKQCNESGLHSLSFRSMQFYIGVKPDQDCHHTTYTFRSMLFHVDVKRLRYWKGISLH